MAITVKSILNNAETVFRDLGNGVYEASITAPNKDGEYQIQIIASNETGDSAEVSVDINVSSWITPKVNWQPTDRFTVVDYERIRNNMISIADLLSYEFGVIKLEDMGEIGYYSEEKSLRWEYEHFNSFEKNLEYFNEIIPLEDFGMSQTFYANGLFIKYDELNRIENLLILFKKKIEQIGVGVRKLPFRLGTFREVRT